MVILEFYYFSAVYADEVIVGGFFEEVWIVSGLPVAEVDFLKKLRLCQEGEGPVEGSSRCAGFGPPQLLPQFVCRKVLVALKNDVYDSIALRSLPEAFRPDESIKLLLNLCQHTFIMTPKTFR